MLNKAIYQGRITRDPELKRTQSGTLVTSFTLAVERVIPNPATNERETDFIDCVAWKNRAEFVSKYFTKGRMMIVEGKTQTRTYTDQSGNKRKVTELVADAVYFGDSKPQEQAPVTNFAAPQVNNFAIMPQADDNFNSWDNSGIDDSDLPF